MTIPIIDGNNNLKYAETASGDGSQGSPFVWKHEDPLLKQILGDLSNGVASPDAIFRDPTKHHTIVELLKGLLVQVTGYTSVERDGDLRLLDNKAELLAFNFVENVAGNANKGASQEYLQRAIASLLQGVAREETLKRLEWKSVWLNSGSSSYTAVRKSEEYYTVPAGVEWQLISVYIDFITTAAAGNRQMMVRVENNVGIIAYLPAGSVQGASTDRHYTYAVGLPDLTAFRDTNKLSSSLPPLILPAGFRIRILDSAAVDPTNDDLATRLIVMERAVS